jgi:hypothetical protein
VPIKSCGADPAPLQRALVSGLFPHAARRQPDGGWVRRLISSQLGTRTTAHASVNFIMAALPSPCLAVARAGKARRGDIFSLL